MSMSNFRRLASCSVFACTVFLTACSENEDPANVSFADVDRSALSTNVVANQDLSASASEATGWDSGVDVTDGAIASFKMVELEEGQGGNAIEGSIINIEPATLAGQIYAGPTSVPVTPGKSYGVAVYAQGARCGSVNLAATPAGDPATILGEKSYFLNGEPQSLDFYFQVPEGVTSVDLPVQMGNSDNLSEMVYVDRMTAIPRPIPVTGPEGSVLSNGSFEKSSTDLNVTDEDGEATWGNFGEANFSVVDSTVTEAQDGENMLRIVFPVEGTGAANSQPYEIEGGPVNIVGNTGFTYTYVVWIKGDEGAKVNFILQNSQAYNVYGEQAVSVTEEWQEVRFEATVTEDATLRQYAQFNFPENAGKTIYIDNYQLIPPTTCPYEPLKNNKLSENADLFEYDHVTNGSFEDDAEALTGWATEVAGDAAADFELQVTDPEANINRSLVYDGNNSLKVTVNTAGANPTDIMATPADLYVEPGKTYTYSGYVRGATDTKAYFAAQVIGGDAITVVEDGEITFSNIWQQIIFDFTVPAEAPVLTAEELAAAGLEEDAVLSKLNLAVGLSYAENVNKRFLIDNFSLLPNAVVNGDVEGGADGWSWQAPEGVATFEVDSTEGEAHAGLNSLKVEIGELPTEELNVWDIQAGLVDIPVIGGRTYYVSTRIKGDAEARARISLALPVDPYTEFGALAGEDGEDEDTDPDGIEVNGSWQEVTFAAVIPSGVTTLQLVAQLGYADNANKTIYLDSFRVVSQIPPKPADEGWVTTIPDGTAAELDNAQVVDGDYSLRFDIGALDAETVVASDVQATVASLEVKPETDYTVTAFVKGEAGTKATLLVTTAGTSDEVIGEAQDIEMTGDWQEIKFVVTAPETIAAVDLVAQFGYPENANQSIYLDEFGLKQVAGSANMVTNGGLEYATTEGWNANGGAIAASQGSAFTGNWGLAVTDRTATWNSAQYNVTDLGLTEGAIYFYSVWARIDTETADTLKLTLQITYEGSDEPAYVTLGQIDSVEPQEWVQLGGNVTYQPPGDVTDVRVYIEAAAEGTAYSVDDLFITKMYATNGDFETGESAPWYGANADIAATDAEAHSGTYSLLTTGRTADWNGPQLSLTDTGMEPGKTYQFSAWVKANGDTDNVIMTAQITYEDSGLNQYINIAQSADTEEWVELKGTYTYLPTSEDPTGFTLYFQAVTETSSFYVDDVTIYEVVPSPTIITNGGFEQGTSAGWNPSGNTTAIDVKLDPVYAYSGVYGALVTGRDMNWNGPQYNLLETGLIEGASYWASAWVKVNGETADNIELTFFYDDGSPNYLPVASSGDADTLGWTHLTGIFSYAPTAEVTATNFYLQATGAATEFYVDDVVITQMFTPNGDLENSEDGTANWNAAGGTITVSTDEFHSGAQSLYVSERSANWNSAQYDLLNSGMEIGKTYDISAWVKFDGDVEDSLIMTVEIQDDDNETNQYVPIAQTTDSSGWVQLTSKYTYMPDGTPTVFKVYFQTGDGETEVFPAFYVDDLVIKEASESYPY